MTSFQVLARSGKARAGVLTLPHGTVHTPIFMPVGTVGSVKGVAPAELETLGAEIILGNTYHLWQRPGLEVVSRHGGLHSMARWSRPILTDSGGYQVFSLKAISKVTDDGVTFRSHIDGQKLFLSPEQSMHIQTVLGADIAMALDHCPPADADRAVIVDAMDRTTRWAYRSLHAPPSELLAGQLRFGIIQGGTDVALRRHHINEICALDFAGFALGGLAVGEPPEETWRVLHEVADLLPAQKARYVMGIGTPRDLLEAVAAGVDMFDCVMPTRHARNGQLFVRDGRINIANAQHRLDTRPLDEGCGCPSCSAGFSRAYLRHLYQAGEILYSRLATLHNLYFYLDLIRRARQAILEDRYAAFCAAALGGGC